MGTYYDDNLTDALYQDLLRRAAPRQPDPVQVTPEPPKDQGFTGALKSGFLSQMGDVASLGIAAGSQGARDYQLEMQRKAAEAYNTPSLKETVADPFNKLGAFIEGNIGGSAAQLPAYLAAAGLGARVGATALAPFGPQAAAVGGLGGSVLGMAPLFFGSNVSRQTQVQEEQKAAGKPVQPYDFGEAGGAAVLQAGLDRFALGAALSNTRLGRMIGVTDDVAQPPTSFLGAVGRGAKRGALAEAPVEIGQTALERAQADLSVTDSDAMWEMAGAGVAGGIMGGALGGTARGVQYGFDLTKPKPAENKPGDTGPTSAAPTEPTAPADGSPATSVTPVAGAMSAPLPDYEPTTLRRRMFELRRPSTQLTQDELTHVESTLTAKLAETRSAIVAAREAGATPSELNRLERNRRRYLAVLDSVQQGDTNRPFMRRIARELRDSQLQAVKQHIANGTAPDVAQRTVAQGVSPATTAPTDVAQGVSPATVQATPSLTSSPDFDAAEAQRLQANEDQLVSSAEQPRRTAVQERLFADAAQRRKDTYVAEATQAVEPTKAGLIEQQRVLRGAAEASVNNLNAQANALIDQADRIETAARAAAMSKTGRPFKGGKAKARMEAAVKEAEALRAKALDLQRGADATDIGPDVLFSKKPARIGASESETRLIRQYEHRFDWDAIFAKKGQTAQKAEFDAQVVDMIDTVSHELLKGDTYLAPKGLKGHVDRQLDALADGAMVPAWAIGGQRMVLDAAETGDYSLIRDTLIQARLRTIRQWESAILYHMDASDYAGKLRVWLDLDRVATEDRMSVPPSPVIQDSMADVDPIIAEASARDGKFIDVYEAILADKATQRGSVLEDDGGAWYRFSGSADEPYLTAISAKTWCTSQGSARSYLQYGDFYVYLKKGDKRASIAVRMDGGRIGEIQNVANDRSITATDKTKVDALLTSEGITSSYTATIVTNNASVTAYMVRLIRDIRRKDAAAIAEAEAMLGVEKFGRWSVPGILSQRDIPLLNELMEAQPDTKFYAPSMHVQELSGVTPNRLHVGELRTAYALSTPTDVARVFNNFSQSLAHINVLSCGIGNVGDLLPGPDAEALHKLEAARDSTLLMSSVTISNQAKEKYLDAYAIARDEITTFMVSRRAKLIAAVEAVIPSNIGKVHASKPAYSADKNGYVFSFTATGKNSRYVGPTSTKVADLDTLTTRDRNVTVRALPKPAEIDSQKENLDYGTPGLRRAIADMFFAGGKDKIKLVNMGPSASGTYAYTKGGVVFVNTRNVTEYTVLPIVLHELGVHIGMKKVLGTAGLKRLANHIRGWADNGPENERTIAERAMWRIPEDTKPEHVDEELVAYFVEEAVNAGVAPTQGRMALWRSVAEALGFFMKKVRDALVKFGLRPKEFTAQDIVDFAYGAAGLALHKDTPPNTPRGGGSDTSVLYSKKPLSKPTSPETRAINRNINNTLKATGGTAWELFRNKKDKYLTGLYFNRSFINKYAAKFPALKSYWDALQKRINIQTTHERAVKDIYDSFDTATTDEALKAEANKLVKDSTMEGQWAFNPSEEGIASMKDVNAPISAALSARFSAIKATSPQLAKAIVDVFAYNRAAQAALNKAFTTAERDALKDQLAEAKKLRSQALAEKLTQQVAEQDAEIARLTEGLRKVETMPLANADSPLPYASLKRFGNYIIVGRSAEYRDNLARAREGDEAATKWIRENEANKDHYVMTTAESELAAIRERNRLTQEEPDMQWEHFEATTGDTFLTEIPSEVAARIYDLAKYEADKALLDEKVGKQQLAVLAAQLYYTYLENQHALKTNLRRRNIAGANEDMMRAFASQGRSNAMLLATLGTSRETSEALAALRVQANAAPAGGRAEAQRVLNETLLRHRDLTTFRDTPVQDTLMSTSSLWLLLTNPSYMMLNLMQPIMMTGPVVSGRHGIVNTSNAMREGYGAIAQALSGDFIKAFKTGDMDYSRLRYEDGNDRGLMDLLRTLEDNNLLQIGMEAELGQIVDPSYAVTKKMGAALNVLRTVTHVLELINRVSTAMAANKLEYDKLISQGVDQATAKAQAAEYAKNVIIDTHGDYSRQNAPRLMLQGAKTIPVKVMFQFWKFRFIQIALMYKLAKDSLTDSAATPEAKAEARRALRNIMVSHAFFAGALGMPFVSTAAAGMAMMFGDEGEDTETTLRRWTGNNDLLLGGVPKALGYGVTERIGAGQMFTPYPFVDTDGPLKAAAPDLALAIMGPSASLIANAGLGAVDHFRDGHPMQGLESMMPAVVKNALKATRHQLDGLESKAGNTLISPEEFGWFDWFMTTLGIPPSSVADTYWRINAVDKAEAFYNKEAQNIKADYIDAWKANDEDGMMAATEAWGNYMERARNMGLKPQPLNKLYSAPKEEMRQEAKRVGGVQVTSANRELVSRLE